jgi:hypothetical protein
VFQVSTGEEERGETSKSQNGEAIPTMIPHHHRLRRRHLLLRQADLQKNRNRRRKVRKSIIAIQHQ